MKIPPICAAFCFALSACGGPEDDSKPTHTVPPEVEQALARKPPDDKAPAKSRRVTISKEAKQAVLDRVGELKKITAELKPLITPKRDPEGALKKEAKLQALFDEFNRLGKIALDAGLTEIQLARYTASLVPDEWGDVMKEFTQCRLMVSQLGEPQKEMMNRLMGTDKSVGIEDHLKNMKKDRPPIKKLPGIGEQYYPEE